MWMIQLAGFLRSYGYSCNGQGAILFFFKESSMVVDHVHYLKKDLVREHVQYKGPNSFQFSKRLLLSVFKVFCTYYTESSVFKVFMNIVIVVNALR
jgi:hypothetical protein